MKIAEIITAGLENPAHKSEPYFSKAEMGAFQQTEIAQPYEIGLALH